MPQNFRIVIPNHLYRSGQIAPSEVKPMYNPPLNVRRIVSLDQNNGTTIDPYIPKGMQHIIFPLFESDPANEARKLSTAIKNDLLDINGGTLVHCKLGQDRTGLAIALYHVIKQGWPCTKAIQEAQSIGYGNGLQKQVLTQYNGEICGNCKISHQHYCQNISEDISEDISQVDDIVNDMRDNFSHQQGWNSTGVIVPGASTDYSFAPYSSPSTEGPFGAKTAKKSRKLILKKIIEIEPEMELIEKDVNLISIPTSGDIDNYGGSGPLSAPSNTPGSPNSAAFTADPMGLVQL